MAWIKRNLFFVIGSLVALALMAAGVVYLLSQIGEEQRISTDIQTKYATLSDLAGKVPHPGTPTTVDNVAATKEQQAQVAAYIAKAKKVFQPITPIPDFTTNRISNSEFAAQLRNTVAQLHHAAEQAGVQLTVPDYYFTFEAQKKIMNFDPASIDSLARHLGEVKALSEVIFDAKVFSLDMIRREVVSVNDNNPADYLPTQKTISTPLADLTPYELTFRCFSGELAEVLSGMASSPHGFIVKAINIEHVNSGLMADGTAMDTAAADAAAAQAQMQRDLMMRERMMANRGGDRAGPRGFPPPGPAPVAPAAGRGSQAVLTETPVRVTLLVQVVKIKAPGK